MHKIEKDGQNYRYRGYRITRHDTERGYSGHWHAKTGSIWRGNVHLIESDTRRSLVRLIDIHLDGDAFKVTDTGKEIQRLNTVIGVLKMALVGIVVECNSEYGTKEQCSLAAEEAIKYLEGK